MIHTDTAAMKVYLKYNKAEMTDVPTFSHADIDSILIYIESLPEAQPVAFPINMN